MTTDGALIDNELDESSSAALARQASDEGLRQRYEELRQTGAPLAASFDALLEQASLARLRAAIPADEPLRQPSRRFAGFALRELAAGLCHRAPRDGGRSMDRTELWAAWRTEDWRSPVVEYTDLYTTENLQWVVSEEIRAEFQAVLGSWP